MNLPTLPPRQREIFSAIYSRPGLSALEVAQVAGVPVGSIGKLTHRLESLGLVETRWDGQYRYCYPAPWTVGP